MRAAIARSGMEAATLRQALDFIQAPDTRQINFGQGQPAPPRGLVFVNPSGVLLMASRLPASPPGKTYEMWIIRGGSPRAAGLFASDGQGNGSTSIARKPRQRAATSWPSRWSRREASTHRRRHPLLRCRSNVELQLSAVNRLTSENQRSD
jgi:hypothetical protein